MARKGAIRMSMSLSDTQCPTNALLSIPLLYILSIDDIMSGPNSAKKICTDNFLYTRINCECICNLSGSSVNVSWKVRKLNTYTLYRWRCPPNWIRTENLFCFNLGLCQEMHPSLVSPLNLFLIYMIDDVYNLISCD